VFFCKNWILKIILGKFMAQLIQNVISARPSLQEWQNAINEELKFLNQNQLTIQASYQHLIDLSTAKDQEKMSTNLNGMTSSVTAIKNKITLLQTTLPQIYTSLGSSDLEKVRKTFLTLNTRMACFSSALQKAVVTIKSVKHAIENPVDSDKPSQCNVLSIFKTLSLKMQNFLQQPFHQPLLTNPAASPDDFIEDENETFLTKNS
jgi:hypothetical protein